MVDWGTDSYSHSFAHGPDTTNEFVDLSPVHSFLHVSHTCGIQLIIPKHENVSSVWYLTAIAPAYNKRHRFVAVALSSKKDTNCQMTCTKHVRSFVQPNGQIFIPAAEVSVLLQKYQPWRLIEALSTLLMSLPYPHKKLFAGSADVKFKCLQTMDWKARVSERVMMPENLTQFYIRGNWLRSAMLAHPFMIIGLERSDYEKMNILGDFFTEKARLNSRRRGFTCTPMELWITSFNKIWLKRMLNSLTTNEVPVSIDSKLLRETMASECMDRACFVECSQFKLTVAVVMMRRFNATRVLDFCSGWGDRLLAAVACDVEYTGVDPNPDLCAGYAEIIQTLATEDQHKDEKFVMINAPFETAVLPSNKMYDFVFTGPPCYNCEVYSHPSNQSALSDTPLDEWVKTRLFAWLLKAWDVLEVGGHMAINIADTSQCNAFVEAMNLYIQAELKGAQFVGVVASEMYTPRRIIPIWTWRKADIAASESCDAQATEAMCELRMLYPHFCKKVNTV